MAPLSGAAQSGGAHSGAAPPGDAGRRRPAGHPAAIPDWRSFAPPQLPPILAGALEAFYQHGYHGTSVRDIARRAGVTVPALYYHYENKQGILIALLDVGITEALARAEAALASADDDPTNRLARFVEAIVLYMTNWVNMAYLDGELRYLEAENRRRYAAHRKRLENMLVNILVDGSSSGAFDVTHPPDTARALLGMCQAIAGWYRPDGPLAPDDVARRYVDIAARTVGAHGAPRP
jgi:AcrR family transcriptional regulator